MANRVTGTKEIDMEDEASRAVVGEVLEKMVPGKGGSSSSTRKRSSSSSGGRDKRKSRISIYKDKKACPHKQNYIHIYIYACRFYIYNTQIPLYINMYLDMYI